MPVRGPVSRYVSPGVCQAGVRTDREIVLAAVQLNGYALRYAAKELRADREIVLAAVQQNGCALEDAAEERRGDRPRKSKFACKSKHPSPRMSKFAFKSKHTGERIQRNMVDFFLDRYNIRIQS